MKENLHKLLVDISLSIILDVQSGKIMLISGTCLSTFSLSTHKFFKNFFICLMGGKGCTSFHFSISHIRIK